MNEHDIFSKDRFNFVKGVLALVVVFHHATQRTDIFAELPIVKFLCLNLGFYSVASFLFFSGFGLMCSYRRDLNKCSVKVCNKAICLIILNYTLIVMYTLLKFLLGYDFEVQEFLRSIMIGGGNIVTYGWYLQVIILLYLSFAFSAKLGKRMCLWAVIMFSLSFLLTARQTGVPNYYYINTMAFPLGCIVANFKQRIQEVLSHHFCLLFVVMLFLMEFFAGYLFYMNGISNIITQLINMTQGSVFTILLITIMARTKKRFPNTSLSSIFLEIYVLQGIAFLFLRNDYWNCGSDIFIVVASIATTILLAVLFKPLSNKIMNLKVLK